MVGNKERYYRYNLLFSPSQQWRLIDCLAPMKNNIVKYKKVNDNKIQSGIHYPTGKLRRSLYFLYREINKVASKVQLVREQYIPSPIVEEVADKLKLSVKPQDEFLWMIHGYHNNIYVQIIFDKLSQDGRYFWLYDGSSKFIGQHNKKDIIMAVSEYTHYVLNYHLYQNNYPTIHYINVPKTNNLNLNTDTTSPSLQNNNNVTAVNNSSVTDEGVTSNPIAV